MSIKKEGSSINTKRFDPTKSIKRARSGKIRSPKWRIKVTEDEFVWATKMDRVGIIRKGLPYESIEVIGKSADLPVKQVLHLFGI